MVCNYILVPLIFWHLKKCSLFRPVKYGSDKLTVMKIGHFFWWILVITNRHYCLQTYFSFCSYCISVFLYFFHLPFKIDWQVWLCHSSHKNISVKLLRNIWVEATKNTSDVNQKITDVISVTRIVCLSFELTSFFRIFWQFSFHCYDTNQTFPR